MNVKKLNWWLNSGEAPVIPFEPSQLGSKLRGWYEVSGLVNNTTNAYGVVASGVCTQLSDKSGNGFHFTVAPASNGPAFDGTKLVFATASSRGLYSPSLVADINNDTQGEIIACYQKPLGASAYPFCSGILADTSKQCVFGQIELGASDRSIILVDPGATANQLRYDVIPNSKKLTHSFSSNGTAYKVVHEYQGERVEETLSSTVTGSNNGDWFGDVVPDFAAMFVSLDGTDTFWSGDFYCMFIFNEQLTIQERSNMFCYINNIYSVWP